MNNSYWVTIAAGTLAAAVAVACQAPVSATQRDAATVDAPAIDARSSADAAIADAAMPDARRADAAWPDAAVADAAMPDADPTLCPAPPPGLTHYITGDPDDAVATPMGPGLVLMGGGADVDAAMAWMTARSGGGDVVVLRTSGADGYNDYLYTEIGGVNSVETLLVTTVGLANSDYVTCRLAHAEAIFLAGGDQSYYLNAWTGTGVQTQLDAAWSRGAIIGGTSAGAVVLGEIAFSAQQGTVYSSEALLDPYNQYMTFAQGFMQLPPLAGITVDTHFAERDRMGRLIAFVARTLHDGWVDPPAFGLGIDERTAMVIDAQDPAATTGTVMGTGAIYLARGAGLPALCQPGSPLVYPQVPVHKLHAGDTVLLPSGTTTSSAYPVSASDGVLTPASPY